jgi:predicted RND superfamily exporter protein
MGQSGKTDIRVAIERRFGQWGEFSNRHSWLVIFGFLLVIAAFASQLTKLRIDTSNESILHETNPIRVTYNEFRHQYGRDERAILIVETDDTIYDTDFLKKLEALHRDLEDNGHRIVEVNSLINARRTWGEGDSLIVEDLLEEIPDTPEGLKALEEVVKANPIYQGQFITDTDTVTFVYLETEAYTSIGYEDVDELGGFDDGFGEDVEEENGVADEPQDKDEEVRPFLTGEENTEIVEGIDAVVARHHSPGFTIQAGGTPHFMDALLISVMNDMTKFSTSAIILISIVLGIIFKRLVLVFLPLLVSILSVTLTLSVLGMLDIPFTVALQIMPTFLLAVGVSNSVHIFNAFFQARNAGDDKQSAIVHALEHSGFAIAMSAFTTAGGLLSFAAAEILPVSYFGLASAGGIVFSFIFSVGLLPALINILPVREGSTESMITAASQKALQVMGNFAATRPGPVVTAWALVLGFGLLTFANIRLSHEPIKWLVPEDPVRVTMDRLNEEFGGSMFLEIVVDTGKENGIKDPEILRRIEQVYEEAHAYDGKINITKAVSVLDVVKETHQALNANDESFYAIPDDRLLLAQELLLFENSGNDDLENLVDSLFSQARITLKTTDTDAVNYEGFQEVFYQRVRDIFADLKGDGLEVIFTGFWTNIGETIPALQRSLINSYTLAFMTITPIMMFMLGSIRTGALSMLPNIAPILVAIALLGVTDIPLDTFTLMIGSIALGLAVDDTIHFMHNYQRNMNLHGDNHRAIQESLRTSGQAILFTSVVLVLAFLVYTMSNIAALINFGILLAVSIITAFLADALLAPALVTLVDRHHKKHPAK